MNTQILARILHFLEFGNLVLQRSWWQSTEVNFLCCLWFLLSYPGFTIIFRSRYFQIQTSGFCTWAWKGYAFLPFSACPASSLLSNSREILICNLLCTAVIQFSYRKIKFLCLFSAWGPQVAFHITKFPHHNFQWSLLSMSLPACFFQSKMS